MTPASGAMSADLLSRVCAELDARMAQLRPALDEYGELLAAAEELDRDAAAPKRRGSRGSAAGVLELAASGAGKRTASRGVKPAVSGSRKPAASSASKPSAAGPRTRAASGSGKRAAAGSSKRAAAGSSKRAAAGSDKRAASGSRKRAAAGSGKRAAAGSSKRAAVGSGKRAAGSAVPRGVAEQAIVAALEHGSHTVGELVLVTAMAGSQIRSSAQRLQRAGAITRTKREGRAAYALSGVAEG
jgi:hypothetical protein